MITPNIVDSALRHILDKESADERKLYIVYRNTPCLEDNTGIIFFHGRVCAIVAIYTDKHVKVNDQSDDSLWDGPAGSMVITIPSELREHDLSIPSDITFDFSNRENANEGRIFTFGEEEIFINVLRSIVDAILATNPTVAQEFYQYRDKKLSWYDAVLPKLRQLESACLEPDGNVMADLFREIDALYDKFWEPKHPKDAKVHHYVKYTRLQAVRYDGFNLEGIKKFVNTMAIANSYIADGNEEQPFSVGDYFVKFADSNAIIVMKPEEFEQKFHPTFDPRASK